MKKVTVVMLALIFCMTALLAGCGNTAQKAEDFSAAFVGEWKATEMTAAGQTITAADLEAGNMVVSMTLAEDKSLTMTLLGVEQTGTWEAKSATVVTITMNEVAQDFTLEDGKIVIEQGGTKVVFEKV